MEGQSDISLRLLTLDLVDRAPPSRPTQRYQDQCTARMIGKTMDKKTVCIWVSGFYPYFFLQCPEGWHDYQLSDLREYIHLNGRNMENNLVDCTIQQSHRTFGFSDGHIFPFVKLSFRSVRAMNTCRHLFNNPIKLSEDDEPKLYKVCEFKGVPAVLKAIHDTKIQPSGWVKVAAGAYRIIRGETRAAINLHTSLKSIVPFSSDDIPQFVEMSFDGEMVSENWVFPQATRPFDPITQLGVQFAYSGEDTAFYKVMFCLDEMGDLSADGVEVRCHATEAELLMDFHRVLIQQDPDILTGYNIVRFDIPYILKRAKLLKLPKEFFVLGRFLNERTELRVSYKSRENQERKITYDVPILGGRRLEDCMNSVKNLQKKLTSYKLDYVANFYLGVGKHDVEAEDIFRAYQNTTDLMVAQHNQGLVQRMLTEVRIMKAFDHVTRAATENMATTDVIEAIATQWPREYRQQILGCCREIFALIKCGETFTPDQATELLNQYVDLRRRGTTLVFGNSMMDLNERWLTCGISIDNLDGLSPTASPKTPSSLTTTKKRGLVEPVDVMADIQGLTRNQGYYMEMFKKWERRIEAEQDILHVVIQQRTTRKFAEKWWILRQEIKTQTTLAGQPMTEERLTFAQNYFAAQVEKQRAWHLAEKTRIGRYCMQDAALPIRLRKHHQFLISLMEMSQVTWVPCNMLLEKGQTIKVINLIVLWARENNYVVTVEAIPEVHFKGGCVLVPKKNFYKERVFTLDFASLYPSLIQSHKLCYLSFIMPRDVEAGTYQGREDLEIAEIDIGPPSNTKYQWVTNKRTLLPEMLEELVNRRRMVKKALAKADDPQMQIILNQRQLALKLVCNSTYGFTGYQFSPWPCLPIAVCTTVKGRDAINITKKMAEDHFNANVVYGDSVTGDTPILIRYSTVFGTQVVEYVSIERLHEYLRSPVWGIYHGGKESIEVVGNLEVWSEQGFTQVKRIIRHLTNKDIYRVMTPTGVVKVTEDHSLLKPDGQEICPNQVRVGMALMHADLPMLPEKNHDMEPMMMYEFSDACQAATMYWRKVASGITPELFYKNGQYVIFPRKYHRSDDNRVRTLTNLGPHPGFVYDLETENHHFAAGVGKMVVHNTDSIMAIVPIPHHLITDLEKMQYVFDVAQKAAAFITEKCFTAPMKLEFEKVYYPYLLLSKKRYSGQKYTNPEKSDGIDTKGIEAIRRDNCPLLRDTVIGALNILGYKMDVGLAIKYARRAFIKLANQSATWEELTISKSLAESYKSDSQIHVQVARYLEKNHPLLAPDVGDRVPFVVIKKPNETRATKAYEKGYNPILAEREGHEPDWFHYAFKCLKKPLDRIFCIALGLEYIKGKECQPTDQLWEPYLKRICENDKIQHARVSGNTNLDTFFKKPKVEPFPYDDDTSPAKLPAAVTKVKKEVKSSDIRNMFKK